MKRCLYRIISILLIVYIISAPTVQTHAAGVPLEYLLTARVCVTARK